RAPVAAACRLRGRSRTVLGEAGGVALAAGRTRERARHARIGDALRPRALHAPARTAVDAAGARTAPPQEEVRRVHETGRKARGDPRDERDGARERGEVRIPDESPFRAGGVVAGAPAERDAVLGEALRGSGRRSE